MGVTLGWIAVALAGLAGAPRAERENVQIQYTVRFVEIEGLGWREAVYTRLTPVTRQGAATVWTAPRSVAKRLLQRALKDHAARVVEAPDITAWNGMPAHFSIRSDRRLVTQVAWDGDDRPAGAKPETVRIGPVGTMAGRTIDQGVLVQLVLEDSEVRAVHRVPLAGQAAPKTSPETKKAAYHAEECTESPACCGSSEGTHAVVKAIEKAGVGRAVVASTACAPCVEGAVCESASVAIEVPEIASQEIAGEWLIPNDGILLVSFGPYTVAGKDGQAVIRERLAILTAEADVDGTVPRTSPAPRSFLIPSPAVPITERVLRAIPAPAVVPNLPMAVPAPPGRSIPQGVHADGTPADLPPLPADEEEKSPSTESAEPMPSPQTKKPKPQQPGPATDAAMKKTGYNTTSRLPAIPAVFLLPTPTVGLQFLVPIKPLSLRLPFNRRLEIEIFGRIVRNPEPISISKSGE